MKFLNALKISLLFLGALSFVSCNQGRIEELESDNEELKKEIANLEARASELESQNNEQAETLLDFEDRFRRIRSSLNNAQSGVHNVKFWHSDEFFFDSAVRNLSGEIDNALRQIPTL